MAIQLLMARQLHTLILTMTHKGTDLKPFKEGDEVWLPGGNEKEKL